MAKTLFSVGALAGSNFITFLDSASTSTKYAKRLQYIFLEQEGTSRRFYSCSYIGCRGGGGPVAGDLGLLVLILSSRFVFLVTLVCAVALDIFTILAFFFFALTYSFNFILLLL